MKTKLIALFVSMMLVLVLSACGAPAAAPTAVPAEGGEAAEATEIPAEAPVDGAIVAKFDFNNVGTVDICELYLSPVGTDTWGPDQLQGQTITAGGKFTLTNIPANSYDAKWVGCDKTEGTIVVDIK